MLRAFPFRLVLHSSGNLWPRNNWCGYSWSHLLFLAVLVHLNLHSSEQRSSIYSFDFWLSNLPERRVKDVFVACNSLSFNFLDKLVDLGADRIDIRSHFCKWPSHMRFTSDHNLLLHDGSPWLQSSYINSCWQKDRRQRHIWRSKVNNYFLFAYVCDFWNFRYYSVFQPRVPYFDFHSDPRSPWEIFIR